jgi:hypothetical protein
MVQMWFLNLTLRTFVVFRTAMCYARCSALASELSLFFQNLESFEAQLADALSDRNKATETISSLQVRVIHMRFILLFSLV